MADEAAILVDVGRVLLGGLFLFAGIRHILLLDTFTELVASRGLPSPRMALIAASIWEAAFGAMLMLGIAVGWAAFALVVFTVVATVVCLNFWDMEGEQRHGAFNGALTNVGVVGGLLIAAAAG